MGSIALFGSNGDIVNEVAVPIAFVGFFDRRWINEDLRARQALANQDAPLAHVQGRYRFLAKVSMKRLALLLIFSLSSHAIRPGRTRFEACLMSLVLLYTV